MFEADFYNKETNEFFSGLFQTKTEAIAFLEEMKAKYPNGSGECICASRELVYRV